MYDVVQLYVIITFKTLLYSWNITFPHIFSYYLANIQLYLSVGDDKENVGYRRDYGPVLQQKKPDQSVITSFKIKITLKLSFSHYFDYTEKYSVFID